MELKDQARILGLSYPFLEEKDIDGLLEISTYRTFKNKEALISTGQYSSLLFFILKGMVRGFFINEKGEEKNVFLRPEHTVAGAPDSLFAQSPTKYTFETVADTDLLLYTYEDFMQLGFENPHIMKMLITSYQEIIQTLIYRVESMIDKAPEERYESLLERSPQFFEQAYQKTCSQLSGDHCCIAFSDH